MVRGSTLFKDMPAIHFIKCDIEGYEEYVLLEIKLILEKHKPILQLETWGTHKPVIEDFLFNLRYEKYSLVNKKLEK